MPRASACACRSKAARNRSRSTSRKLPGKVSAAGPADVEPDRVRPHLPRHAGAAISLARRAPTARRRRTIQGALHVDHEHAAAALSQAHPRAEHRGVEIRLYRRERLGQLRSRVVDAVQSGSASDPSAGRKGQRAASDAPHQLQGRAFRFRRAHRDSSPAAGRHRSSAVRHRGWQDRAAGETQGARIRFSCRWQNGRCY